MRGWLGYYGIAEMKNDMEKWNEWVRRRIRMYIWKQWKLPKTRVENLKKLGMPDWQAYRNRLSGKRLSRGNPSLCLLHRPFVWLDSFLHKIFRGASTNGQPLTRFGSIILRGEGDRPNNATSASAWGRHCHAARISYELRMIERVVKAALFDQLLVISLLDDRAVLYHKDRIGVLNG